MPTRRFSCFSGGRHVYLSWVVWPRRHLRRLCVGCPFVTWTNRNGASLRLGQIFHSMWSVKPLTSGEPGCVHVWRKKSSINQSINHLFASSHRSTHNRNSKIEFLKCKEIKFSTVQYNYDIRCILHVLNVWWRIFLTTVWLTDYIYMCTLCMTHCFLFLLVWFLILCL